MQTLQSSTAALELSSCQWLGKAIQQTLQLTKTVNRPNSKLAPRPYSSWLRRIYKVKTKGKFIR